MCSRTIGVIVCAGGIPTATNWPAILLLMEVPLLCANHVEGLYVFGGRGRTRADADGRGRTRTDADGRGHFIFFYFFYFFIFCLAQLERDPESDRLGHPPPPHASWSHKDTYSLPVKPILYLFSWGGGVLPIFFICICAARMPLFLTIFLSLAT